MTEDSNITNPATPPATSIVAPEPAKHPDNGDAELKSINAMVDALIALNEEQRLRALDYVFRRFTATALQTHAPITPLPAVQSAVSSSSTHHVFELHHPASTTIHDIRTLKETKAPKSAIEMVVLVAYYVSELAPDVDRKNEITKPDVERYFKMAGFNLPSDANFTLVNAKNAGYLDSSKAGHYKLNPVGYNLVVHRMGNRDAEIKERGRGRKPAAKRRPQPAKQALRNKR